MRVPHKSISEAIRGALEQVKYTGETSNNAVHDEALARVLDVVGNELMPAMVSPNEEVAAWAKEFWKRVGEKEVK